MISVKECCLIGRTEGPGDDESNGVIRKNDIIVGTVNAYISWYVDTGRALNRGHIEAVVNFSGPRRHDTLATSECKKACESE